MEDDTNDAENSIGALYELSKNQREVRADGGATTATPSQSAPGPSAQGPTAPEIRVRLAAELGIEGYDPNRTQSPPYLASTRRDIAVALTDLEMDRACFIPAYELTQYVRDEVLVDGNDGYECWTLDELEQLLELAADVGGEGT